MYSIHIQYSINSPKKAHRFTDVCWISVTLTPAKVFPVLNRVGRLFTQLCGFIYLSFPESDAVISLQESKALRLQWVITASVLVQGALHWGYAPRDLCAGIRAKIQPELSLH